MSNAKPYEMLSPASLANRLAALTDIRALLGGSPDDWNVREVGDGNLNLVFIVEGKGGSVCVKQALPYVRVAGPSWPMTLQRAFYENAYYRNVTRLVGRLVPAIHHYDPDQHFTVMECLQPHVILRHGLIAGTRYPNLARDVGQYVARACFGTSDFAQPFESKMDGIALFTGNKPLIRISVDLIFAEPYRLADRNRHTSPQLDDIAAEIRNDIELKLAVCRFGAKFLGEPQALLHGDLHSGSLMVTPADTRIIDPEFAFYGPIGFDLGAFFGNLLLNWCSQPGHEAVPGDRADYQAWIVEQLEIFWSAFESRWLAQWADGGVGDAYPAVLLASAGNDPRLTATRQEFMESLFADMIGFAACKMIRRILGFAHIVDFDSIGDPERRARFERGALRLAMTMLKSPERFRRVADVVDALPNRR